MNSPSQSKLLTEEPKSTEAPFVLLENIITDRGSKYSVSGGRVTSREEIKAFLKKLKSNKKYAQATHNSYAARCEKNGLIWETKNDDGETGAGMVILRQLQKSSWTNLVVVVTRWFGGTKLHGDRFRHVQEGTKIFLSKIENRKTGI